SCQNLNANIKAAMIPLISSVLEPSPSINYDFVAGSYFIASLLCLALAVSSLVFEVSSVKGWWIALAPFPPALVWSLIVRARWHLALESKTKVE
ncbi:hypothetical protein NGA_2080720, partial [Nannochloropsis gaditana CCMP526]